VRKIILLYWLLFFCFATKAQIIAGDSISTNVQYTNVEKNTGFTMIDIDNDGTNDILFYTNVYSVGGTGSAIDDADYKAQALQNNMEFFITSAGACDTAPPNSIIDNNLIWANGIGSGYGRSLAFHDGTNNTWSGSFASPKDNFMGFRIIYPSDTAYGWILIGPYADLIKSFAIQKTVTGIKELGDNGEQVNIYPNPASNYINVTATKSITEIKLVDVLGKEVLSTKETNIDLSSLQDGIYFMQVKIAEGILTKKVIVQR